jgi:hypothetical protein
MVCVISAGCCAKQTKVRIYKLALKYSFFMDVLENDHSLRNGENLGCWKYRIFEIAFEAK